jgi:hypothetical protein
MNETTKPTTSSILRFSAFIRDTFKKIIKEQKKNHFQKR